MSLRLFALSLLTSLPVLAIAEPPLERPLASKGKLLFEEDFQRDDLGKWKEVIPRFNVADGMLTGGQDKPSHGSVGRIYLPMKDVVMSFRFRLNGSPRFNVVFDDKAHKGSHAGHILRVAVAMKEIRLGDDKEGLMRNDIFKMRRDPKQSDAATKLLVGRSSAAKVQLEQKRWYKMNIELLGDQMRVSLDGKPIGHLKSSGLAHPTKQSVHFTISGNETNFDDVQIWSAKPTK